MNMAYAGKLLRVDLTRKRIQTESLNNDWARSFIGGKGLAARYLLEELQSGTDPLSPDNIIIFATGPLAGTLAPCSSRHVVVTKSPITGAFLDSYAGGFFGPELKFAGFDLVIIRGKAEKPVYLLIQDDKAELKSAGHIWGKNTHDTEKIVRDETNRDVKVASIGPAGENLVKFACITNDLYRQAGRGGAGAVMGSKKLKAIAVSGTNGVEVPDIDSFIELCKELIKNDVLGNPDNEWAIVDGTPHIVERNQMAGILPTNNFRSGMFEGANEIDLEALRRKILVRRKACFGCPIACGNFSVVRDGPFKGTAVEGPEYETLALSGSNCLIDDIEAIANFNLQCDQLGLDTISAGNVIAFAMECYERGLLSIVETDGLTLNFGNVETYVKMPQLIASRKGIGKLLADGVKKAAEKLGKGSERFTVHVKGLEYPGYDPRGSIGMALAYATSDRGACHQRAWPAGSEAYGFFVGKRADPFTTEGKAQLVIDDQNKFAIKWSLITCDFYSIDYPNMARIYSAATGNATDEKHFRLVGERIWNLTRIFNVREGFRRKDDTLPTRIAEDPLLEGKAKGHIVMRQDFERMLSEYYALRGWDKDGVPTREKLVELGLAEIFGI